VECYTDTRPNLATTVGHAPTMSFWLDIVFRRLIVFLLALSIAGGAGVSSSRVHPTRMGDKFDCQTEAGQSDSLRLKYTAFATSDEQNIELGAKSSKSESNSKKVSDSACCSAICSSSAMLVEVFLPAMRKDPQENWNVSSREPVPAGYDPLRRPPRTTSEID
jgi:hypothetical protein